MHVAAALDEVLALEARVEDVRSVGDDDPVLDYASEHPIEAFETVAGSVWQDVEGIFSGDAKAAGRGAVGIASTAGPGGVVKLLAKTKVVGVAGVLRVAKARVYSTAFEARLSPSSYPRVSRARHFQEANEQLLRVMESNPDFADMMRNLGVKLERTPSGLAPRRPPANWTWHHDGEPGVMRLVPSEQHTPGSPFWNVLHPSGRGGYSKWGKQQ